jgi:hypothetical protein
MTREKRKYRFDQNRWFYNEKPGIIERILVKLFRVRIIISVAELGTKIYLRRFYLSPRWRWLPFRIFLHHIFLSDKRVLHSHPWSFISLLLSGSYKEIIQDGFTAIGKHKVELTVDRFVKAGALLLNPLTHIHRLELTKPMWTLVFASKAKQMWGFYPPEKNYQFVPWREYLNVPNAEDYPEDIF